MSKLTTATLGMALVLASCLGACGWVADMARGRPEWRTVTQKPSTYGLVAKRVEILSARAA
jgi:hypothetical protein